MWWRSPYVASIGVVIIGLALSFSAWFAVLQRENRLAHEEFDARAGDHFLVLQNGIDRYINDISALRAAFQASEHGIGRREFQSFSDQLLHEQTAIFAASWIPRVTRDQRPAHELEAARDGLSGYGIKSVAADGSLSTAEEASEYFPIFYSSREIPGSSVYGIDLNDGGLRQRTLERARDEDRAAASPNFVLRRGEGDRDGFFVVLPVYRPGLPHDTVEDRRRNLVGFAQGVFQTGVMIEDILNHGHGGGFGSLFFLPKIPALVHPRSTFTARAREPARPRRCRERRLPRVCTGLVTSRSQTAAGHSSRRRFLAGLESPPI
jgi:CHASE1-domain containing sensor protein